MAGTIEEQIQATGLAQVLVYLKEPSAKESGIKGLSARESGIASAATVTRDAAEGLVHYFDRSEFGRDGALMRAAVEAKRRGWEGAEVGMRDMPLASMATRTATPPGPRIFPNLNLMLGTVDTGGLKELRKDRRVSGVAAAPELSLIRPAAATVAALPTGPSWGLLRMNTPKLWDDGLRGAGVLVGHLDTGVDAGHPALTGAVAHFAEFDLLGVPVAGATPRDTDQHGTHTAGTLVGRAVGASSFGVAPEATLASAIVIEGGNVIARVLAGMDWVIGLGARVLSMSLGIRGYTGAFLGVTRILRARGVLPVFALGNEGPGTSRSPGNYAEALSVGACSEADQVAWFSSSQRFRQEDRIVPRLVAPGADVISCIPGGGYESLSGTSMATPHVAGLAALLFGAYPEASVDQIEQAILASCRRPASMSEERASRGVPDAPRALKALKQTLPESGPTSVTVPTQPPRKKPKARAKSSTKEKAKARTKSS